MTYRFEVYNWMSSFVWPDVALKKTGLIDLIYVTKKKSSRIAGRIGFVNSMPLAGRINPVGFLDLTRIAAIRLNHLMDHLLGSTTLGTGIDIRNKTGVCTCHSL